MNHLHKFTSKLVFIALLFVAIACSKDDDPEKIWDVPVASEATDITQTGFTASWSAIEGATVYFLDLSTDNFETRVGEYNGKSVTGNSLTLTGLTPNTSYKYRVRASDGITGSNNSNEVSVKTLDLVVVGKVDGVDFKPSTIALTDTNVGLELAFKDATNDFSFRLSDKIDGTYEIESLLPAARVKEPAQSSIAFWTKGSKVFFGTSGSITIATVSGKVNVTFTLNGVSEDGTASQISNGKIDNLTIGSIPSGQCLLTEYDEEADENGYGEFAYDSQGRLIQMTLDDSYWNFFWVGSEVAKAVYSDDDYLNIETWTYDDGKISQITASHTSSWDMSTDSYEITFEYTGAKLTKTTRTESLAGTEVNSYVNNITYTGDNVTEVIRDRNRDGDEDQAIMTYEQYDTKNNFWMLLANALKNPLPLGSEDGLDAQFLSKNNAGLMTYSFNGNEIATQTFEYTSYTSGGYPTVINYTYSEGEDYTSSSSVQMAYSGCGN